MSLALFSAQLGKLDQKEIKPANEINSPVVVCSVEWIASINPNIISVFQKITYNLSLNELLINPGINSRMFFIVVVFAVMNFFCCSLSTFSI